MDLIRPRRSAARHPMGRQFPGIDMSARAVTGSEFSARPLHSGVASPAGFFISQKRRLSRSSALRLILLTYGLTTSLSRPDNNVTGVSVDAGLELWGKRLAILRELIPSVSRVGFLTIRASWDGPQGQILSRAGREIGVTIVGPPLDDPVHPPGISTCAQPNVSGQG